MDREEAKKIYNTSANLRLKHIALCVIGVAIAILISMIFLMDKVSWQLWFFMHGCTGVLAIIFVIMVAILVYRVNRAYFTGDRRNKNGHLFPGVGLYRWGRFRRAYIKPEPSYISHSILSFLCRRYSEGVCPVTVLNCLLKCP